MTDLIDPHTHSIASGHGSPAMIHQMAAAAKAAGLKILCVTDHGPATLGSAGLSYFGSLHLAPEHRSGVRVLYGCEANILDLQGNLDLPDEILKKLDFVIASLHTACVKPGSMQENTDVLLRLMEKPYIHMIGHPDDARFPLDYYRLAHASLVTGTFLELNNASLTEDGYRPNAAELDTQMLLICKEMKVPILLGSDAHGTAGIGRFESCRKLISQLCFPEELIINTQPKQFLEQISGMP